MSESEQYDEKPDVEGQVKPKDRSDYVKYWLDALEAVSTEDKDWRKEGENAIAVYRGDKEHDADIGRHTEFNIFHSNVETTLPAIYNSTPSPDVRRRFGDKDAVAKTVSQMIERNLSYSVDAYDFDETMRQVLFDGLVPGRGLARVRYVPYFTKATPEPGEAPGEAEADSEERQIAPPVPEQGEVLSYEEVCCEYVPWKRVRIGPADCWEQVPWIAFEHLLTRDEIEKVAEDEKDVESVQLDCRVDGAPADATDDVKKSDTMKRGRVWEIWDREDRKVIFIATGFTTKPLREEDDPLGLEGFFPIPRPVQPISTPGNMVPVTPYSIYKALVEEINELTFRIKRLTKQIRVRGGFGAGQADLENLMNADDGELVPIQGMEAWMDGGIDKAITWWPIEPTTKALVALYQQREAVKQSIYEITGISDIVRGASKASETATAQQIKSQWGSVRIQKLQGDVQRFARDLFRLKAEIISTKFSPETVMMIAGIKLLPQAQKQQLQGMMGHNGGPPMPGQQPAPPPQLPQEIMEALERPSVEEVFGVMKSDLMRAYRVDVESDSTIRADLTRKQKDMSDFLQGTAQYIAAVGPAVQSGQMPGPVAVEIFSAFARNFKLGKQAEDALDKMSEASQKPQPPKPDPEAEKAKAQMQLEQQKAQIQQQSDQAKLALEQRKAEMQSANDQSKAQSDMALAQQKMQFDMELEREKAANQYQIEMMKANAEIEIKRQMAAEQAKINAETSRNKMAIQAQEYSDKAAMNEGSVQ